MKDDGQSIFPPPDPCAPSSSFGSYSVKSSFRNVSSYCDHVLQGQTEVGRVGVTLQIIIFPAITWSRWPPHEKHRCQYYYSTSLSQLSSLSPTLFAFPVFRPQLPYIVLGLSSKHCAFCRHQSYDILRPKPPASSRCFVAAARIS